MISSKKIVILGAYPPPYGGISVHVQRMLQYLNPVDYIFFNQSKSRFSDKDIDCVWIKRYFQALRFLIVKYRIIHHHGPDKYMRVYLCFIGLLYRNVYLHIHGESLLNALSKPGIISLILKRMLRYVHILASNKDIVKLIEPYRPLSVSEIDAYLPPRFVERVYEQFYADLKLPEAAIIITMVGWFTEYNNEDLYGYDLLLEALRELRKQGEDVIVVASVNGIKDEIIYQAFMVKLKEYQMEDWFILLTDDYPEIWPLYFVGDIFVRASNTDGSALSIKEAVWSGAQVIASDCVSRPEGVILFKNRDYFDLVSKIKGLSKTELKNRAERMSEVNRQKFTYSLMKDIYNVETT